MALELIQDNQMESRIITLSGLIDEQSVSEALQRILCIIDTDVRNNERFKNYQYVPIQLYINSCGGSVDSMWSLIDVIESSGTPIVTFCSGMCASAAAMIFLAGHYRFMYKHSSLMLHQMIVGNMGKIVDFTEDVAFFQHQHERFMRFIKKHTKLSKKKIRRIDEKKEDLYLTAKECLKYGVCDSIIKKSSMREMMLQLHDESTEIIDDM